MCIVFRSEDAAVLIVKLRETTSQSSLKRASGWSEEAAADPIVEIRETIISHNRNSRGYKQNKGAKYSWPAKTHLCDPAAVL